MESMQNSSHRRQRKAAQMARVRDYFAQRDEGGDSDIDNPHSGIKQATWVENLKDKHFCVQEEGELESPLFVSEACKTCSQHVCNAACDYTCSKQPDSAVLAQGECATALLNEPLHSADQDATTEQEKPREYLTKTSIKNIVNMTSLVGHSNSGTRLAPLNHQGFSRVLAENPNGKSPVNTPVNTPPFKTKENCDIVPKNTKSNTSSSKRNVSENQDLDNQFLDAILTAFNDKHMLHCADTVQNPDLRGPDTAQSQQHHSGDASERLSAVNSVLVKDFLNPHTFSESMYLQETAKGKEITLDLGITADPLVWTCEQFLTTEKSSAGKTDKVSKVFQSKQKGENEGGKVIKDDDDNNVAFTNICTNLNPSKNSNTVSKSSTNERVSPYEPDKINLTSPEICQQENISIEEDIKDILIPQKCNKNNSGEVKAICEPAGFVISNQNSHADTFEGTTDENPPDKTMHYIVEAVVLKENETICLIDNMWVKNPVTMVEEKENSTLKNEEEDELLKSKSENKKEVEKDTSKRNKKKIVEKGGDDKVQVDKVDNVAVIRNIEWMSEDETAMILFDKETELEDVRMFMTKKNTEENKTQTEMQAMYDFLEMQQVSTEKECVQEDEEMEKNMEMDLNYDGETGEKQGNRRENQEKIDHRDEILADKTATTYTDSNVAAGGRGDEDEHSEERSPVTKNKAEDSLSALLGNELEVMKKSTKDGAWILTETLLFEHATCDHSTESLALENILTDEPESDRMSHSSSSAESSSDDEVELYIHYLRAAFASTQARKDAGFTVSRGKLSLQSMPPISESLDEDVLLCDSWEKPEDVQKAETSRQDNKGIQRCKETFSCCSLSKALLYFALLVIFLAVTYYYDFLAWFGFYLLSIIWLCCQGEREPVKHNDK